MKHFALYGAPEAGRDYNLVDMGRMRMYNEYFLPYKAAVEEGAATVMSAFNEVEGVPAAANKWLLDDVLRKQWGFDGFVVSDWDAVREITVHGIGDLQEVSVRALDAGLDMDMASPGLCQDGPGVARGGPDHGKTDRPGLPPGAGGEIQAGALCGPL